MGKRKRGDQDRVLKRVRYAVIGFAIGVVAIVLGYGLLYSSGATDSDEIVEGEHYRLLDDPLRRRPGESIDVVEFFSYACLYCWEFEPLLADWQRDLPEDVRLERAPVSFGAAWTLLAQAYLALEAAGGLEENHERLFRAIHDNARQFRSADQLADFVNGRGIERQAFLDAFNSPRVRRKLRAQADLQQRWRIVSTPTLVVAGRYAVDMEAGRRQALDVVDYLIARERGSGL